MAKHDQSLHQIVADLDRCPHWRHEGDDCGGWTGPGMYDGGCAGGVSTGAPRGTLDLVVGATVHGEQITIRDLIAAERRERGLTA